MAITWDNVGERLYQEGVDRGVIYIGGEGVAWNGLTKVENQTPGRNLPLYMDGEKYMESQLTSEYEGSISAFTYPDLFEYALGVHTDSNGLRFHDQHPLPFDLSYRTLLGDDVNGLNRGYIIHLLYSLYASAESAAFVTSADAVKPVEFTWKLRSVPRRISGRRPTAHLSVDSTKISPAALEALETALYGAREPTLPDIPSVIDTIQNPDQPLTVVNNGDGTWTATGSLAAIRMINSSRFEITHPGAVILDPDTYTLPT